MELETVTQVVALANGSAVLILTLSRIRERLRKPLRNVPEAAGHRASGAPVTR